MTKTLTLRTKKSFARNADIRRKNMQKITNKKALAKCIESARKAGCPREQVEILLNSGYIPYPWQWMFHSQARAADLPDGPVDIGLGGARGPGKSHAVMSQAALDDCQRVSGLKGLFLRQTGQSAIESFGDLIAKAVRGRTEYHQTKNSIVFPNTSKIILGGFRDDRDIDKYVGIEYDEIIVEELTQLSQDKYDKLRGSLRTSKPNWRPRMYTSFNPGGIGHAWVRERYVLPHREKKETDTRFVPSTYKENPALNPEYIKYLEALSGDLGKAWREGEWDVFAGQYFKTWRYEKHVCEPFEIPDTWIRFRSIDPSGRDGVTSCHWYALDPDGRVWVYREYYYTGLDHDQHAKAIHDLSEEDGVQEEYPYSVIDAAAFAKAGYSETAVEIYERHGVTGLIPAAKERVVGWNAVNSYLRWGFNTQPLLKIFSTCHNMIRTIPLAQHDQFHPEDVASIRQNFKDKKGIQGTEHQDALDELRYFLRTLRENKAQRPMTAVERRIKELKALSDENDY